MKNLYQIIFSICFITILNCGGCIDPDECPDRFNIPATIYPYKIEYHIGDTITLISKFNRHVHETRTDRSYDMININWYPNAFIQYLDTNGYNNTNISDYFFPIFGANCKETKVSFNDHSVLDCNYIY
ncbi:MAG: hypothetical protein IPL25_13620 [Saprospiraceae bacterium]|nr:hypothetical protein [Candidatus Vicinibacter affinis]